MKKGDSKERIRTEKGRNNEERLRRLVDILQHPFESVRSFLDYALEQTVELTDSRLGYIFHYDEEKKEFIVNTWSHEALENCSIENYEMVYSLEQTGIWGEAVRQRKPIVINNFQEEHPLKKGYPQGHVELINFLSIPIFKEEKIIGVVGLANKADDYVEADILQTTLLMKAVFNVTEVRKTEETLKELSARMKLATRAAGIGVWDWELDKDYILFDEQMKKLYDLEDPKGLIKNERWKKLYHPDDLGPTMKKLQQAIDGEREYENEFRIIWRNGEVHHIRALATVLRDENNKAVRMIGANWDITKEIEDMHELMAANEKLQGEIFERQLIEEALRTSEEKFKTIVDTSPDGIAIASMEGVLEFATDTGLALWGYDIDDDIIGQNILDFIDESYHDKAKYYLHKMNDGEIPGAEEYLMIKKDGSLFYCEVNANILRDSSGNPKGILIMERDVTERKQMEEELKQLAIKDQLTGLFNRRKIDQVMEEHTSEIPGNNLSVIMVDIDRFKQVNDEHGHLIGDEVLISVSRILENNIRRTDILGRWGGEEFIIICKDTDLEGAASLAEKLRNLIANHTFGSVGKKTCSFGVAQLKVDETTDSVISRSDEALYRAKESGRNRVRTECEIKSRNS